MKAKLTVQERRDAKALLVEISNNANVMASTLDPENQSRVKDGERYVMARHFDAIFKLARAASLKIDGD